MDERGGAVRERAVVLDTGQWYDAGATVRIASGCHRTGASFVSSPTAGATARCWSADELP